MAKALKIVSKDLIYMVRASVSDVQVVEISYLPATPTLKYI